MEEKKKSFKEDCSGCEGVEDEEEAMEDDN
jgi:hypothetical protein